MFRGFFYAQIFYKGIKALITGTDGIVAVVVVVVVVLCRGGLGYVVVWFLSANKLTERTDMNTSTRITASLMDAINKHPKGFTMDVNTGEVIDHGIAVGGYHQDHGFTEPNWIQWRNGEAIDPRTFEVLETAVSESLDAIQSAGFIGGWVDSYNGITLDIVQVYDCIIHSQGIQEATAFLEGSRLQQEAIGWLCPDFNGGYKEVMVNF
jgi:hypothetical protein